MCTMKHWMLMTNILRGFWMSPRSSIQLMPQPSSPLLKLHCKLPLHIMGLCPIIQIRYLLQWTFLLNNSLLLPIIDAPTFVNLVGESFWILELKFLVKSSEKFYSLPPSFSKRMKPSKCSTRGFSSSKRILRASQTWKLPIGIFICWKVLWHSMHRFRNRFLQNLETRTLC